MGFGCSNQKDRESWRKMKINFNNNILYKKTSWVCDLQFAKQKTSPCICKYEKETQRHETTGHCYPAQDFDRAG